MTLSPLGYTQLTIPDLKRSLAFYENTLGLQLLNRENGSAELGVGSTKLLGLTEDPETAHPLRSTGLYHFALRLPARADLARFTQHIIDTQTPVQGASDHQVSEAIYLPDPDGNGIEVYHDRSTDEWYDAGGDLVLTTRPLNLDNLLSEIPQQEDDWDGMPAGTDLGHIHLHVADLEATRQFYVDLMGMDLVAEYGDSALFFSWNGYHHHIGANTWNGTNAPAPPPNAAGLEYFTYELDPAHVKEIQSRLETEGVEISQMEAGLLVHDPAGNGMVLSHR